MTRARYIFLSATFFAAALACWLIQYSARNALRDRTQAARQIEKQLAALTAENQALSNKIAQTSQVEPLSPDELRELSRLRGEVGALRYTIGEINRLRDTNARYAAELAASEPSPDSDVPPQARQEHWPREQFAFAGFDEPEAALKTTLWIWADADLNSILPHCTPEDRTRLEEALSQWSEADLAAARQRMASMYSLDRGGVSLMGKKLTSPEAALVDLYFEGDGKRRRFSLQKTGQQWTVTGLVAIYN